MTNLVKVLDNGPMQLVGEFEVTDEKGQTLRQRKVLTLCRCGLSGNSPFCDGSHEAAGFASCPRAPSANAAN